MKKLCLLLFLFIGTFNIPAQENPIITVLDFSTSGISEGEMKAMISLLSSELFQVGKYQLIDISERDTLLKEIEFSAMDCTDENCQIEIGKMLSAEIIVVGSISKVGSKYVISSKMLETATSRTVSTADGIYQDMDSLLEGVSSVARKLAGLPITAQIDESATADYGEEAQPTRKRIPPRKIAAYSALGGGIVLGGTGGWLLYNAVKYLNGPVEQAFQDYDTATSDFDRLYDVYLSEYSIYRRRMIAGVSVAGGGAALLISYVVLVVRPERKSESEKPINLLVLPNPTGYGLFLRVDF